MCLGGVLVSHCLPHPASAPGGSGSSAAVMSAATGHYDVLPRPGSRMAARDIDQPALALPEPVGQNAASRGHPSPNGYSV
jgi:hypothetical protein